MKRFLATVALLLALCMSFAGCDFLPTASSSSSSSSSSESSSTPDIGSGTIDNIPPYAGNSYVHINDGIPSFTADEITTTAYEFYSELDSLGRCGYAEACIGKELMPTEDRGSISSVSPSGWVQASYDCVDGGYLYNRCHLIGFQLTGENANKKNLITGTRYLNNEGMLLFENMVADYIRETNNHVMYRVTPLYAGSNLVASGVQIEAYSVEDEGDGIEFNVYFYNVQPLIYINYATGESRLATEGEIIVPQPTPGDSSSSEDTSSSEQESSSADTEEHDYVLNTNTKKFHSPSCSSATDMSAQNRQDYHGTRQGVLDMGYEPCGKCKP